MRGNILSEMLLIQEPSVFKLYQEMMRIAGYFIAPVFSMALLLEYFGEMDFGGVIKKLLLVTIFMSCFYQVHTKGVELSLESASETLKKVSPRNLFVKKWFNVKVRTKEQKQWSFLESFAIPNLNDLLATGFFLLAKVFIWLLKLIFSSVYHLTYVFSGLTAVLYFLGWTKDALKGTVQASLWCMFLPFVIVAILALVGNSIDETALAGGLIIAKVDTIIWLFGVTLLLLMSPVIAFGLLKGDGIHSFGSKMGSIVVSSGMKGAALAPIIASFPNKIAKVSNQAKQIKENIKDRISGGKNSELKQLKGSDNKLSEKQQSFVQGRENSTQVKTHDNKVQTERFQKAGSQMKIKESNQARSEIKSGHLKTNSISQFKPLIQKPEQMKSQNQTREASHKEIRTRRDFKNQVSSKNNTTKVREVRRDKNELR